MVTLREPCGSGIGIWRSCYGGLWLALYKNCLITLIVSSSLVISLLSMVGLVSGFEPNIRNATRSQGSTRDWMG